MPTYEFRCDECGATFTLTESMSEHDRHEEQCPACGTSRVTQLYSTFYAKTSRKS